MKFGIFSDYGALNSRPVFDALATAIRRKNWVTAHHDMDADVAVVWSVSKHSKMSRNTVVWNHFQAMGRPIIVLEIGCLDRGNLWKVGLGNINGLGYFGPKGMDDQRRKKLNLRLRDWRQRNEILLCSQHTNCRQWDGMPNLDVWIDNTVKQLKKYTDRKIVVRFHPRHALKKTSTDDRLVYEYPREENSFASALDRSWAVINWNSCPGVVAAQLGVPVFVGSDSLAAPVGNLDFSKIESPTMPNREQWFNDLVYTEWLLDEISNGEPLERLTSELTSRIK
jgi:hypothetical protein